jgi:8-oxo-dGTP diphosphatase
MAARRQQKTRATLARATKRATTMKVATPSKVAPSRAPAPYRRKGGPVPGTDFPSADGALPAVPPIQTRADQKAVAPWPLIDRYPFIIGVSLTANYLAACMRLAITGYRQQLVDVLGELLDLDGHMFAVVEKRVLSTANGRLEIKPVDLPEDHPDRELAQKAADMVQTEVNRIPNLTQTIASLLWGIYYGPTAAEIFWTRDSDGWHIDRFDFIHSRRLAYPEMQSYTLYIWDQGQVLGNESFGTSPTNISVFGTPIAEWPGKFLTFAPQLRGDYPTREGIGRELAIWALFKRAGVRGGMGYLERFAKGFLLGKYTTQSDGQPREATPEDIAELEQAIASVGPGTGSGCTIPNSTDIVPTGYEGQGTSKIGYAEWVDLCNSEMSKIALGGTLSTDHRGSGGLGGSGTAEVQERGEVDLEQYDATMFAEAFRHDVVYWLVKQNMPEALRVLPQAFINVDREPDAKTVFENATSMTKIGGRVDLKKISNQTGIPLIQEEENDDGDDKPAGSFLSDVIDPSLVFSDLLSDEAKQEKADKTEHDQQVAMVKAQQPPMAPPGAAGGSAPANANGKQPGGGKQAPGGKGKTTTSAPGKGGKDKNGKTAGKAKLTLVGEEAKDDQGVRFLLKSATVSNIGDRNVAIQVYEHLLADYPAKSLYWIPGVPWAGPLEIPIDEIDFSSANRWRASHEDIGPYVEKIREAKGDWKPVVLVKTPGNPKFVIVDGHHRVLAYKRLGWPVKAFVATTRTDEGPWDELHDMQKKAPSKGSWANEDSPSWTASHMPSWGKQPASYDGPPPHPTAAVEMNAKPNASLPAAAIALVFDEAGRVLTVSRPEPPHEQAFPGGIVDAGEAPDFACARELKEETGLSTGQARDKRGSPLVEHVLTTSSPSDGRTVYVYRVLHPYGTAYAAEPGTVVRWMTVPEFFAQSVIFRDTIRELMARDLLTPVAADAAAQ